MVVILYIFISITICHGIKLSVPNTFKYAFVKPRKEQDDDNRNPVYLLVSPEDVSGDCTVVPRDVNVVNNNDSDEIVGNLKSRIFSNEPTLLNFQPSVDLGEKTRNPNNKVTDEVLKLSQMMLLSDRVVVPLDYLKLVERGCTGVKELELLGLVLFSLFLKTRKYPKVNFVVYNFDPIPNRKHFNSYEKEYITRHKYELQERLNEFIQSFTRSPSQGDSDPVGSVVNLLNSDCDYVDIYSNIKDVLKDMFKADREYFKACKGELDNEFKSKLKMCEDIDSFSMLTKDNKQTKFNFQEFTQIHQNLQTYSYIYVTYEMTVGSFLEKLREFFKGEVNPSGLKEKVDRVVAETLNDYDLKTLKVDKTDKFLNKVVEDMRTRLVEGIKSCLYRVNQDLFGRMVVDLFKGHEEDVRSLKELNGLDDVLADLIGKYDSKLLDKAREIKYQILENYGLYEALVKAVRFDMISSMRDYSNKIMENVIMSGKYYHRFSILDGIRFIPNRRIINFIQRIISKIRVPINLKVLYLSPNAFGLSNYLRPKDARYPNTYVYFTGKSRDK